MTYIPDEEVPLANYGEVEGVFTGSEKVIYDSLKKQIREVAMGKRTSTAFTISLSDLGMTKQYTAKELGVSTLVTGNKISEEAQQAMRSILRIDNRRIMDCLLADCPYDLYWYDKVAGCTCNGAGLRVSGNKISFTGPLKYTFKVSEGYRGSDVSVISHEKQAAAAAAAVEAQRVVDSCSGMTDAEKLQTYLDYICEAVSYNSGAAGDTAGAYGDAWQLIYVFDGDNTTNVLCEGYSKAFQYLCDLTEFTDPAVTCYTVCGTMDGGNHMWNLINMGTGASYLVDVTNSDKDMIGQFGGLYMSGALKGSVSDGYIFNAKKNENIEYEYGSDIIRLYGDQVLTVSASDYTA